MAVLEIARDSLLSRIKRKEITGGNLRKFNISTALETIENRDQNGLLQSITRFLSPIASFVQGILTRLVFPLLRFSASAIWGMCVGTVDFIMNFDWNQSDQSIQGGIRGRNIAVFSSWGGTIGSAFGWVAAVAVGSAITYNLPVIGGAMLAKLASGEVIQEGLEEVTANLESSIRLTTRNMIQNNLANAYMQFRKLVKSVDRGTLTRIFGERVATAIKDTWGAEGAPSYTLAGARDNLIERLPFGEGIRAFIEEFLEEAWDSFIEGGYIIAGEIDSYIAQSKAGAEQAKGSEKTIIVIPNRNAPDERYALIGGAKQLKEQVQDTIHEYRKIYNRDVGQLVGQPVNDWLRAQPHRRKMTIVFRDKEKPPWRHPNGDLCKTIDYTIPEMKLGLSWRQIKTAAKPFMWGKFRCTANLQSGRQMAVYGATAAAAEEKLRELLSLSTDEILTVSVTEEKDRNPRLRKDPTRMYPCYVTVLVRRPSTDLNGRTDLSGQVWDEENRRWDLWVDDEPPGFQLVTSIPSSGSSSSSGGS